MQTVSNSDDSTDNYNQNTCHYDYLWLLYERNHHIDSTLQKNVINHQQTIINHHFPIVTLQLLK